LQDVESEKESIQQEFEKATALRAAYNADREAFIDKIKRLERDIESGQIVHKQQEEKQKMSV